MWATTLSVPKNKGFWPSHLSCEWSCTFLECHALAVSRYRQWVQNMTAAMQQSQSVNSALHVWLWFYDWQFLTSIICHQITPLSQNKWNQHSFAWTDFANWWAVESSGPCNGASKEAQPLPWKQSHGWHASSVGPVQSCDQNHEFKKTNWNKHQSFFSRTLLHVIGIRVPFQHTLKVGLKEGCRSSSQRVQTRRLWTVIIIIISIIDTWYTVWRFLLLLDLNLYVYTTLGIQHKSE